MTPWQHAVSSAKKFGGIPEQYIHIHEWFDETKQYTGNWTHRALRHHAAGIQWCIQHFGHAIEIARGTQAKDIPVKLIAEQHVIEDCGYIPTVQDWLQVLANNPADWMLKVKTKSTTPMKIEDDDEHPTAT